MVEILNGIWHILKRAGSVFFEKMNEYINKLAIDNVFP